MHYTSSDWASLMLHNILDQQTLVIEFRLISLYLELPRRLLRVFMPSYTPLTALSAVQVDGSQWSTAASVLITLVNRGKINDLTLWYWVT